MKTQMVWILISAIPLWIGCASTRTPPALAPVGPAPGGPEFKNLSEGSLQVFSARQAYEPVNLNGVIFAEGEAIDAYEPAHTDYVICDQQRRLVKKITNAHGLNDPTPAVVTLPAGSYLVQAQARGTGWVTVPVVIQPGRSTLVNLQRSWALPDARSHRDEFVWLDGQAVGWRSK